MSGRSVRPVAKPPGVRKPAGSMPSRVFMASLVRRMFSRITSAGGLPLDQPRRAAKAKLNVLGPRGRDVHVIVGVIADRVPGLHDRLEPIDVLLLQHAADGEAVQHAAMRLHAAAGLDRVGLGLVVEISLFVVPAHFFPHRKIAAHLQIERDRDLGLPWHRRLVRRATASQRGQLPPPAPSQKRSSRGGNDSLALRFPANCTRKRRMIATDESRRCIEKDEVASLRCTASSGIIVAQFSSRVLRAVVASASVTYLRCAAPADRFANN